jgi:hypothetical protein
MGPDFVKVMDPLEEPIQEAEAKPVEEPMPMPVPEAKLQKGTADLAISLSIYPTQDQVHKASQLPIDENLHRRIMHRIHFQEIKKSHFQFNQQADLEELLHDLRSAFQGGLQIEQSNKRETPDLALLINGEVIAKIHFLGRNKNDVIKPAPLRYYIKIYIYHCKNKNHFQMIQTAIQSFFATWLQRTPTASVRSVSRSVSRRSHKNLKHRRSARKTRSHVRRV